MSQDKTPPEGWTEIPQDQVRDNAFAVMPEPFWPHVCLYFDEAVGYELLVYSTHPIDSEPVLTMALETLVVAEAEYTFDSHRNGKALPHLIAESNSELERKAQALEALARRLRQRHKRPEVIRSKPEGDAHG